MSRLCTSAHAGKWVRKGVHDGGCGHLSSGRFGEGAGSKRGVRKQLVLLPRVRVHGKASKGAHEAFYSRVQASGSNEARAYLKARWPVRSSSRRIQMPPGRVQVRDHGNERARAGLSKHASCQQQEGHASDAGVG